MKLFSKNDQTSGGADWLIVGLGNPGPKYEMTRHNAGFLMLDAIAEHFNIEVRRVKFKGLYGKGTIAGQSAVLLKPSTFMNLSGQSVTEAAAFYKVPMDRVVVLFDDISLEPGRLRVRAEGSAGGHNGIKSIIQELGSQDFPRVKIGVGAKPNPEYDLAAWVLSTFSASEEKALAVSLKNAADAALSIIDNGVPETANRFNGSHP